MEVWKYGSLEVLYHCQSDYLSKTNLTSIINPLDETIRYREGQAIFLYRDIGCVGYDPIHISEIIPAILSGCDNILCVDAPAYEAYADKGMEARVSCPDPDVVFIYYDFISGFYFDKYSELENRVCNRSRN
jgi:hypothetical protein